MDKILAQTFGPKIINTESHNYDTYHPSEKA